MKAEGTVMQQIYPQNREEHLKSLQAQAEVSFKAGVREVVTKIKSLLDEWTEIKDIELLVAELRKIGAEDEH